MSKEMPKRVNSSDNTRLSRPMARELRQAKASISYRWLERVSERVKPDANEVFPTQDLLDHVPLLIEAIADYLENPYEEATAADHIIAKATELGELRYDQGFSSYQILKEFEILGGVILSSMATMVDGIDESAPAGEVVICVHRVQQALAKVQQATAARHLALADQRTNEREYRIRALERLVTTSVEERLDRARQLAHSIRKTVKDGEAAADAESLLAALEIVSAQLDQVGHLSLSSEQARQQRNLPLHGAVREAVRRVRRVAESSGVEVHIQDGLPDVEINGAAVEHCLVVYLTNAIKYADPSSLERWVRVSAHIDTDRDELVVEVEDNGRTVSEDDCTDLFQRFVRGETITGREESGLGLSFVRDTVDGLDGKAWACPAEGHEGSVFAFSLPCRRTTDRAEATTAASPTGAVD